MTIKTWIGAFFIMAGLMAMAGSAGDCDGKCMEYANTMGEMLMTAAIGLMLFGTGVVILITEYKE